MFKLKNQSFSPVISFIINHEKLNFFYAAASAVPEIENSQFHHHNPSTRNTHIQETSPLDPRFHLFALTNCKNLEQVKHLHAQVAVNGLLNDLVVANKLLYVYVNHKALDYAYKLFEKMPERNPVSWSVTIGGFAKAGDRLNCFGTFREYIRSGEPPDVYTLPCVIRVCRDTVDLRMGRLVHHIVHKFGLHMNTYVCAALVDMYAKCGVIDDARRLFDKMTERDLTTWTVMIGGYAACGDASESLALFHRMREDGLVPDRVCMVTVVNACAKIGAMHKAKFVHEILWRQCYSLDVILGTAVIDMYAKCGSVDAAREIFDGMREKNVISWSAMIAAYGYHGQGPKALELFPMMLRSGISPNRITFVSLLYACSHSGLVEEGLRIFSLMQNEYFITPDVKHYTCMVDLLGRAGRLDQALNMIASMKAEKDEGLWGSLLGACRIHNHVEMAQKAAESLLEIQPQNPGNYVLLSNIYAKAGKWQDVARIRTLMNSRKLKKTPGWTWIEANNEFHKFGIGDHRHPRSKEIYEKLENLIKRLELAGYVPDTDFVLHDVDEELKLESLYSHSEKLAIAYGLISTPERTPIRISKNLRVCGDCHTFSKLVSAVEHREIIVRDAKRFHHIKEGVCSCRDYW